eukprot:TRINITY_DN14503_c0_g1_i1.p1 TRINITY_DN14503_c0_g1~~TRINITY_DN14503_c0_g1_i1.p1  ORF type:complete len:435 (+),score=88.20 TRINITY_DN14503_c0_g1_i1:82-1305(+)
MAAAAAAAAGGTVPAHVPTRTFTFAWDGADLTDGPEIPACLGLRDCVSVGRQHYVMVCGRDRAVRCFADNGAGWVATDPPLRRVRSVTCAATFTVALHLDGSVSSWGKRKYRGRAGEAARPGGVRGLPPVAALSCGTRTVMALTRDGEVYGWGSNGCGALALGQAAGPQLEPVRIAALSGRGVRRVAFCVQFGVAETARRLLWWGGRSEQQPARLWCDQEMSFPLRSLAVGVASGRVPEPVLLHAAAADAEGTLWFCGVDCASGRCPPPQRAELGGQRAVKVVAAAETHVDVCGRIVIEWKLTRMVALTEDGALWDVSDPTTACRCISAEFPALRGHVPYGGPHAPHILLVPNRCGGRRRLELFARVAMRLEIPSDPVREVLVPLTVHEAYLTGPSTDPFGAPFARH